MDIPEEIKISDGDVEKCQTYKDGVYISLNNHNELLLDLNDIKKIAKAVGLDVL